MISAFFIFNQKGEVLISRLYRPDFKRSIADVFRIQVVSNSDVRSPIITLGSTSFFHVRVNNLYVVAVTKTNANAALVFEFCYRFISICKAYFGKVDEESVKNNFVVIYELIDEINDFGFPQNSEIDTLKSYITTESIVSTSIAAEESSKITTQATGATSWRRADVKYKKNEAFVDVIEIVNLSMSAKGTVLRADVDGHIQMRAYLSGTPECKFGLNDKLVIDKNEKGGSDAVELDDCRFHQCVRLNEFDAHRIISFIPPDGEFELMRYRCTSNVKLPLRIIPTINEVGTTQVQYTVIVKANFNGKLSATNVVLRIPTPLNTTTADCKVATGKAKYVPAENVIVWKIPRLQGGQECILTGTAALTSTTTRQVWSRPPIDVDFQVLMFTASGLIVRFLKVFEKSNYTSIKWVRYLTKASGSYQVRNGSSIDSLLDKEDVSLEALLDEDDLLQECKSQNNRLIDYFERVDVLHKLFGYVTGQIEGEEKGRFKYAKIIPLSLPYSPSGGTDTSPLPSNPPLSRRVNPSRYPYICTEVLCSDIWSIVETCIREQGQLLLPFWETVLDRSPDDMKTQMSMAAHFAKINSAFMNKKPAEMLAFIQSQPSFVDHLLRHIETPSLVDLLGRIIQLDELVPNGNVLPWLSSQNLMGRLIQLLSPNHTPSVHNVVTDLIKNIISMATPSPGAANLTDSFQGPPTSNLFARELASKDNVTTLTSYMLAEFSDDSCKTPVEHDLNETGDGTLHQPTFDSYVSSVVQSIAVVVELIRKNNSDYFEPYLFHTLRNRLIQIQQHTQLQGEDIKEPLERVMEEMVDRMGVVNLGPLLSVLCDRIQDFQKYLKAPRSMTGPIQSTIGVMTPFLLERYRIVELYAELLHCSNMSLLNRPASFAKMYDSQGRLQGGLAGLEELAQVIAQNSGNDQDPADAAMDEGINEISPALDFPIRGVSDDSASLDSDDVMSDSDHEPNSSDDEAMEEIAMYDEPNPVSAESMLLSASPVGSASAESPATGTAVSSSSSSSSNSNPNAATSSPIDQVGSPAASLGSGSTGSGSGAPASSRSNTRAQGSRRSSRSRRRGTADGQGSSGMAVDTSLPVGEQLKKMLLQENVIATMVDLFFQFPWNNFLHSAVYDIVHQVMTGNVESGFNRELVISLFRDAKILHRIVEGQAVNDRECAKPKGVRLGYMGHLMLISEDVITAMARFPPDLRLTIIQYAPEPQWDEYVTGRYNEAKREDNKLLGGGKPSLNNPRGAGVGQWKVDEDDMSASAAGGGGVVTASGGEMKGEFRRATSVGPPSVRNTADFGPAPMMMSHGDDEDDDDDEDEDNITSGRAPHFARYLSSEMGGGGNAGSSSGSVTDHFSGGGLHSDEDDDDDDEGWLAQSTFTLGSTSISARSLTERRPLSTGFDDAFDPTATTSLSMPHHDPFGAHDDDGFGPFSDTGGSVAESFTFSSSFSDEESFDSFGDFGDFQSGGSTDVESTTGGGDSLMTPTTPTTGSWTFATEGGDSLSSSGIGSEFGPLSTIGVGVGAGAASAPSSGSATGVSDASQQQQTPLPNQTSTDGNAGGSSNGSSSATNGISTATSTTKAM